MSPRSSSARTAILEACWKEVEEGRWQNTTIDALASATNLGGDEARALFGSRVTVEVSPHIHPVAMALIRLRGVDAETCNDCCRFCPREIFEPSGAGRPATLGTSGLQQYGVALGAVIAAIYGASAWYGYWRIGKCRDNLQALLDAEREGALAPAKIALVVSNRPDAHALQRAREAGIEACVVEHRDYANRSALEEALRHPGRELEIVARDGQLRGSALLVLVGQRFFTVIAIGPRNLADKQDRRFLDSFIPTSAD
jgi:hypothetical protein